MEKKRGKREGNDGSGDEIIYPHEGGVGWQNDCKVEQVQSISMKYLHTEWQLQDPLQVSEVAQSSTTLRIDSSQQLGTQRLFINQLLGSYSIVSTK